MNDFHIGVVDTTYLDTQPDCLLAKSVMNQWSKTDPEKDKLLNQISCDDGKTGADCWNTGTYKGVFGPIPNGNPLPHTTPDTNGNCIWTNPDSKAKVNIGPVEPKSSQYAGQCVHNIFYCNGNGLCENKPQGAGKECVCSTGYSPDQDTNNCVAPPPEQKYNCMQSYEQSSNSLIMSCQPTNDASGKSLADCVEFCNPENLYKDKGLDCSHDDIKEYQYCGSCQWFWQHNYCSDSEYGSRDSWLKKGLGGGDAISGANIIVRNPGASDKTYWIDPDVSYEYAPWPWKPPMPCTNVPWLPATLFCLPKGLSIDGKETIKYPY